MSEKIIRFDAKERMLAKARAYLTSLDELNSDGDRGIELLLKAFPLADEALKIKIVIILGTICQPQVAWSLLEIMRDASLTEIVRQAAAIQISVMGAALKEKSDLIRQLQTDLEAEAPIARANAAFALGWEGNIQAAPDLIDCLSDEDIDVQQAAVNALSNLNEESLFVLLAQRLQTGAKEQQRSILYNLCHFPSRYGEAARLCKTFVHHNDPDLRYDALVVLHSLSGSNGNLTIYEHCLDDDDARIRELALLRLGEIQGHRLEHIMPKVRLMIGSDSHAGVRQAAIRLFHQVESISVTKEA